MRKYPYIVCAFVGATAIATLVSACEEETPPPRQRVEVSAPAPKPEARAEAPTPIATPTPAPTPAPTPIASKKDESDPVDLDDVLKQARAAVDGGDLKRALKLARLATKQAPERSASWNTLGRVQLKRGERKDAIASFEKAVELNPSSSYAENNLGLALIYDGRYEDAVDALEEATQLAPIEPYMWNNLGMAYEHLDRLDEAREAYRQAVAAAADGNGGAVAKSNLTRLAGVKTVKPLRTAKIDSVKSDVVPVDEVNVGGDGVDGGSSSDGGTR